MKRLEKKIKELKFLPSISNKVLFNELSNEIEQLKNKNFSLREIYFYLKEKLPNYKVSYDSFRKYYKEYISNREFKGEKEENIKGNKMERNLKKVAVVNFKGGVGKSTIANLLDLPNKVIVNLDIQDAKNSNYSDTINYLALKEEYGVSVNEATELLKEEGKEWIVFDTPGSITEELLEILDDVDYIIIPFTKGKRSKETTIETIKAILEVMDNEKVKFALVLNMYQDENDIEEELKPLENEIKKILGDKYKCSTALKFSKAVSTIEKTKKSIEELDLTNKIAYKAFKKRVKEMNKKLRECLFKEPFKPKIEKYEIDFGY